MKSFLDRILNYYSLSKEDYDKYYFNAAKEDDLLDFNSFQNMSECSTYLKKLLKEDKKILIYGDYDCDGVVATSIIFNSIKEYSNKNVGYYIPFREIDGYGLTTENIDRFHKLGYEIIICVDNGISLIDEIDYLNSLGMECIIFDHHTPSNILPKAKFIIHPEFCTQAKTNMSAGAVCFYFSIAFLGYINKYLLTLASLSIISDVMPLVGYNRTLVRLGISYLNTYKFPQIYSLIAENNEEITERHFSIFISPKINAIGRISTNNNIFAGVKLFTCDEPDKINYYVSLINKINEQRKSIVEDATLNIPPVDPDEKIIVLKLNIKEGIAGIIAAKLLNKYNIPVVVLCPSTTRGTIKGSIRSNDGFNCYEALEYCKDILISYGGHDHAGGLSLKEENFDYLVKNLNQFLSECEKNNNTIVVHQDPIPINVGEISYENYKILRTFAPFGEGHKVPLFKIENFNTTFLTLSKNREHIFTKLSLNSALLYFNYDKSILNKEFVDFFGRLEINNFKGNITAEFIVEDYK